MTAEQLLVIARGVAAAHSFPVCASPYFAHAFIPIQGNLLVSPNEARRLAFEDGARSVRSLKSRLFQYNDRAAMVRLLARSFCRGMPKPPGLVDMTVVVFPGRPWDDDAWHTLGKWVVDGMTDSGLWSKDRRVIRWQRGRIDRTDGHPTGVYVALSGVSDA